MMPRIDLVVSPKLRTSSMKTSRLLKEKGGSYDAFFLDFPMEMEDTVTDLASERMSYDELIDEAYRGHLIPEPMGSWEYAARPVLEALPQISRRYPGLKIYCYGSKEHEFASVSSALRIASLTLKTTLREEVETEEWREALLHSLDLNRKAIEGEAEAIVGRAEGSSICVSDMGGRGLRKPLSEEGLDVRIRFVERPYHFAPLMILKREMARGSVGDEEVERLVRCHLEYVKSYIYRFDNRDRAHYEWVRDKVPWLRPKISREEVELLDKIIL